MTYRRTLCLISTGILTCWAGAASAQAVASQQSEGADIIVTANRTESQLSKTPITMTAVTGDALRTAGVSDARTLGSVVPNLALTESSDGVRVSIRGVTSSDLTEKGDPSAAFLKDGIYIARPTDVLGSFFDIQRVEVLRGPQGTLYGRNTTAGVVNVISVRPQDKFEAKFDAGYGNFNTLDTTGVVNVPLGGGIAIRAAANYQQADSYVRVAGATPVSLDPLRKVFSGRVSIGGNLAENLKFVVIGDYSKTTGAGSLGNYVLPSNFFPGASAPTVDPVYVGSSADAQRTLTLAPTIQPYRHNHTYGVTGELTYDLGFAELTYLGSYRYSYRNELRDVVPFAAFNNPARFVGDFNQDSHELRLAFGKGHPLHGQVGAYYFHEKSSLEFGLGAPLSGIVVPNAIQFAFPQSPTTSISKAAFGQLTYDITPEFHVTGGIRYTQDDKSRYGATVADFANLTDSICGQLRCILSQNIASRTFKHTTWKVGIDYDVPNLGLAYASVSTGYKAGGFNDGCVTGTGIGCALTPAALYYEPETLTAYEAGLKFKFGPNLRVDAAVFHYDYDNIQLQQTVSVPVPGSFVRNAAKAKVDGVEIEAVAQVSANDRLNVNFTYTYGRYTSFVPDVTNYPNFTFNGKLLDHAPRVTAMIGYSHTFPLANGADVELSGRTRLSSEYFIADLNNLSQFRQPGFTKSDATLTYNAAEHRFYVQAYVSNIENKITLADVSSGVAALASIEAPRTFGMRAGVRF